MARNLCTDRFDRQKKRWPNADAARLVARMMIRERDAEFFVYECPKCRGWHVTSRELGSESVAI